MSEAALAKRFAPFLFFSPDEAHHPGEPEEFRRVARFRQSNWSGHRDRGWNVVRNAWEEPGGSDDTFRGAGWEAIRDAIAAETSDLRPGGVKPSDPEHEPPRVTRPRDGRNLWQPGDARGFFLELPEGFGRTKSGADPSSPVSVFCDVQDFTASTGVKWVVVYFWFFYIYNFFVVFEHEGDWEHISLYFQAEDVADAEAAARPDFLFYSAHNAGKLLAADHPSIEWFDDGGQRSGEGTHPGVYVSRWGHPSYPSVSEEFRRQKKLRPWKSWEQPLLMVEKQPWGLFDGAWGEVGESVHSTGPLGPIFKRVDEVTHRKE